MHWKRGAKRPLQERDILEIFLARNTFTIATSLSYSFPSPISCEISHLAAAKACKGSGLGKLPERGPLVHPHFNSWRGFGWNGTEMGKDGPGGSTHTHGGLWLCRAIRQVTGLSGAGVLQRIPPSESLRATTKGSERPVTRSMQGTRKWGEQSLKAIMRGLY